MVINLGHGLLSKFQIIDLKYRKGFLEVEECQYIDALFYVNFYIYIYLFIIFWSLDNIWIWKVKKNLLSIQVNQISFS